MKQCFKSENDILGFESRNIERKITKRQEIFVEDLTINFQ